MYNIEGFIHNRGLTQTLKNNFQKRELIIKVPGSYKDKEGKEIDDTQYVKLECLGKAVKLLDDVRTGYKVRVQFKISGRLWEDKCFTSLVIPAFDDSIEVLESNSTENTADPIVNKGEAIYKSAQDMSDDLPF